MSSPLSRCVNKKQRKFLHQNTIITPPLQDPMILNKIFAYLDAVDLICSVNPTCRIWRAATEIQWKRICETCYNTPFVSTSDAICRWYLEQQQYWMAHSPHHGARLPRPEQVQIRNKSKFFFTMKHPRRNSFRGNDPVLWKGFVPSLIKYPTANPNLFSFDMRGLNFEIASTGGAYSWETLFALFCGVGLSKQELSDDPKFPFMLRDPRCAQGEYELLGAEMEFNVLCINEGRFVNVLNCRSYGTEWWVDGNLRMDALSMCFESGYSYGPIIKFECEAVPPSGTRYRLLTMSFDRHERRMA